MKRAAPRDGDEAMQRQAEIEKLKGREPNDGKNFERFEGAVKSVLGLSPEEARMVIARAKQRKRER